MPFCRPLRACILAGLFVPALLGRQAAAEDRGAPPAAAHEVVAARQQLYASYGEKLSELATWSDEQKLADLADRLRAWLPQRKPDQLCLFVLDQPPAAKASDWPTAAADMLDGQRKFQALRDEQAAALFALAGRALSEHHPSLAFELVTETVRENPDHKAARRLLGYVKYRDGWQTPYAVRQFSAGNIWDQRFGWIAKSHVARYEKGQRLYRNRWVSAADDARLHTDIKDGWRVETEHYVVTTNHSLAEGVGLAERLERLYSLWQQVFVGYVTDEGELARRFKGEQPRARDTRRHNVTYFRTREEYNRALEPSQPQIGITLGIYFDDGQTAYFFADSKQEPSTLYHEATHQLFQETRPVAKDVGRKHNFWVIEAIACYMESLAEHEGYFTLGGPDAGRMRAARQRLLRDQFYVPLAELVDLGMADLQRHADITRLYSQSAGLADFLMHDDEGRYRDALVDYLRLVYRGGATTQTLAELCGARYEQLDGQYRQFMDQQDLAAATEPETSSE